MRGRVETKVILRRWCQGWERIVTRDGAVLSQDLPEWCVLIAGTSATTTVKRGEDARSRIAIVRG